MTSYKFLNASLPIQKTPKESMTDDFQNNLDMEFKVSTDWYTIKEEYPFASGEYVDIDVRINHIIKTKTGLNSGDDYKAILFQNSSHISKVGYLYFFDENYWIVDNTEGIKSLAASVVVKRCNNVLKWIDRETGAILTSPCSINYNIKENRDYSTAGSSLVVPSGFIEVITQFNEKTNKILPNQRFLFGNQSNWTGYKIMGGGINNFNSLKTEDNTSTGIIKLSMLVGQTNSETDDFVLGIADAKENIYNLSLNKNSINIETGQTFPLFATFTINGQIVSRDLLWTSSNINIATVDSSGIITTIATGAVDITCTVDGNPDIYSVCSLTVVSSTVDNYEIKVNPFSNSILEGKTQTYSIYLWLNGVAQSDTFTFSVDVSNTVPEKYYSFSTVDGNNFSIINITRYLNSPLKIKVESGIYNKILDIYLRGAW